MRTIACIILVALSYGYCNAQLKVENSTPKQKKEETYHISEDLYIRELNPQGITYYKFYQKFVNQRIFCISDKAFNTEYSVKQQIIKLPADIKAAIQHNKKQLPFSVNQIATYLYNPEINLSKSEDSEIEVLDDMRGNNVTLRAYRNNGKEESKITIFNASDCIHGIRNKASHAGNSYLIKQVLTPAEASNLLEESSLLSPKGQDKAGNKLYETTISGKTFLSPSLQDNIVILRPRHESFDNKNLYFGSDSHYETPVFLLEDENGELFFTQLNVRKQFIGDITTEKSYCAYIIENHIAYLKEQYVGKPYRIKHYPGPDEIVKIEDLVIRDNQLYVKYVGIKTQSVGYRAMDWNKNRTTPRWEIYSAEEYEP